MKIKKIALIIAVTLLAGIIFTACGGKKKVEKDISGETDITLAHAGSTQYSIVIPQQPDVYESYAAQELQTFFYEVTRARLPIISDAQLQANAQDRYISLGLTSLYSESGYSLTGIYNDGFILKRSNNTLIICGGGGFGTLAGVYEFLEKNLEVKFYAPDEIKADIKFSVKMLDFDETINPSIKDRAGGFYVTNTDRVFALRQRHYSSYGFDIFGDNIWANWAHTHFSLLPPAQYMEDHPDWYSANGEQLCLSNMEMRAEMIESVKRLLIEKPRARYIMVGQMDKNSFCNCSECTKIIESMGNVASGLMMQFINHIAEEVESWLTTAYPEREVIIGTFAYQATQMPPVTSDGEPIHPSVVARDNVLVLIAPIFADWKSDLMHEDYNPTARAILKGWSTVSGRLGVWSYGSNFDVSLQYFDDINSVKTNISTFEELGVDFMFQESRQSVKQANAFDTMRSYIVGRLMWDSSEDVEMLIDDFMDNYFKAAAPYMKQYYYTMRYYVTSKKLEMQNRPLGKYIGTGIWRSNVSDNVYSRGFWSKGVLDQLMSYIQSARAAVNAAGYSSALSEKLDLRIKTESLTPRLTLLQFFSTEYTSSEYLAIAESFIADYDAAGLSYFPIDRTVSNSEIFEKWRTQHK